MPPASHARGRPPSSSAARRASERESESVRLKIEAITVDLWGTLLLDPPASDNRYKRRRIKDFETILGAAGVRVSAGALDRAYEASGAWLARLWKANRDVPVADHVRAILDALGNGVPSRVPGDVFDALVDAYARPALQVPPAVDLAARGPLHALGEHGYRLALVSNVMRTPGSTLRRLLERYDLLRCFAQTVFSDEVGVRKPAPEIFLHALRRLGVEPAAAVHVGDEAILDVQGARAAGMRAVQVTTAPLAPWGPHRPHDAIASLAALPAAIARLEAE